MTRLTLLLLAAALNTNMVISQELPRDNGSIMDAIPPPNSFEELWRTSHVIVRGQVISTAVREAHSAVPRSVRTHIVRITETFKGEDVLDSRKTITVAYFGGTVGPSDNRVTTRLTMPEIGPHADVVLFLKRWTIENAFSPAYGEVGVFVIQPAMNIAMVPAGARNYTVFGDRDSISIPTLLTHLRALRSSIEHK